MVVLKGKHHHHHQQQVSSNWIPPFLNITDTKLMKYETFFIFVKSEETQRQAATRPEIDFCSMSFLAVPLFRSFVRSFLVASGPLLIFLFFLLLLLSFLCSVRFICCYPSPPWRQFQSFQLNRRLGGVGVNGFVFFLLKYLNECNRQAGKERDTVRLCVCISHPKLLWRHNFVDKLRDERGVCVSWLKTTFPAAAQFLFSFHFVLFLFHFEYRRRKCPMLF